MRIGWGILTEIGMEVHRRNPFCECGDAIVSGWLEHLVAQLKPDSAAFVLGIRTATNNFFLKKG